MSLPPKLLPRDAPRLLPCEPEQVPPLDEIRLLMRTLNYGEFTALARAIGADPEKAWYWTCGEGAN